MRVLVVSHCMIPREVRKRLDALAAHPQVEAVQVVVPQEWKEPLSTLRLADHLGSISHSVVGLPVRFGGHPGVYTFVGLDAVVREFHPDIVHCDSEPWSLAAVQTQRAARRVSPSAIFTVYTCDNMPIPLKPWNQWARRRIFARTDGLLCMSTEAVAFARMSGFHGPSIVCPLVGVDPESFKPVPRDAARAALGLPERFTVGFVGRLVPEKGVMTLLDAFIGLTGLKAKVDIEGDKELEKAALPAEEDAGMAATEVTTAQLVFVGRGPLGEEIAARAEGAGVADRVTIVDTVPHGEVPRWLSAMDVLVLPSMENPGRWKEQFGHVIIEAMSSGSAVVGSDSGAIPEVIGDAGLIFPAGDASALADALHLLQSDAAERDRLCIMGHKRVSEHYTHQVVAGIMVDFWASLSKEGR